MRVSTFRRWRGNGWAFEGIREFAIPVTPATSVQDALRRSPFRCQRGGPELTMLDCLRCPHFVNWRPNLMAEQALIRCLFTDDDPVSDLMSMGEALVAVDPETSVADADEAALRRNVRHLLVGRGDEVQGVICRCDLAEVRDRQAPIGLLVTTPPWCVAPDTTLAETAALFREQGIGVALVVDGDKLVGMVTRGDLRRAGCPEELLGARRCVSCGSHHGVIEHPSLGVDMCIDCLELSRPDFVCDEGDGG
jgi:signal-transduction protein with cAMP-binding, CBS, and nucleotidyltransferase domain